MGRVALLAVWAKPGCGLAAAVWPQGCAPDGLSDELCEIGCLDVDTAKEGSRCLEPLALLQVSPDELGGGVASPHKVHGAAWFGLSTGRARGPRGLLVCPDPGRAGKKIRAEQT